ncbi:hypothetical protein BKI52_38495 [marine bacterium AO1-C]|nr:hypothetical protein BKI52_38495 [marine bacterium AO1-C]
MKAKVYSNQYLIGEANLRFYDEGMGVLIGEFEGNQNYFEHIQRHVWEFWETETPDYDTWLSLNFNVQLDNGYFVFPVGGYIFSDIQEIMDVPCQIDIAGVDWHIIQDYFKISPPKPFLEGSWESLTIKQKLKLEQELKKALGLDKGNSTNHLLTQYQFSALCHQLDEVVFSLYSSNPELRYKYALVHLTGRDKQVQKDCPYTLFFEEFEDIQQLREG